MGGENNCKGIFGKSKRHQLLTYTSLVDLHSYIREVSLALRLISGQYLLFGILMISDIVSQLRLTNSLYKSRQLCIYNGAYMHICMVVHNCSYWLKQ